MQELQIILENWKPMENIDCSASKKQVLIGVNWLLY